MRIRLTKLFYVIILASGMHPLTAQQNCEVQLRAKEDTIRGLKFQVEDKEARVREYSIENSELKGQIADLQRKERDAIGAHEAALENLRNEHTGKLSNKNKEIKRQKEQIVSLEEKLERERAECKPLKSKNKDLRSEIEGNQATIARLKSEKITLNNEKKELQSEVEDLKRKNRELVNNNGDLETTKKQLLDKQKQNQVEIRNLNQIIRQKDNAIAQLEPLKANILENIETELDKLYKRPPAEGKLLFSGLEQQFEIALNFKDATDVIEQKNRFDRYKEQSKALESAQDVLSRKYSLLLVNQGVREVSNVNIAIFQELKKELVNNLKGYCQANNEILKIFNVVNSLSNKEARTNVLQNALNNLQFNLESYPFLYEKAKEKQRAIMAKNIPGELKVETCPN